MTNEASATTARRDSDLAARFFTIGDALRTRVAWLVPLLVAAVGIVPTAMALRAQTYAIFGRDQGIFQYVAWALRHGERVYRDIHEINGPLPHAWFAVMQVLGGEDEHVFRTIDTWLLIIAWVSAALTLPRWIGLDVGKDKTWRRRLTLLAWGLAGLTLFGAQYARYDWWHTCQRESLYSALILGSLSLQSIGHCTRSHARATLAFVAASMLTSLPWFGKPLCVIFSLLQIVVVLFDRKNIALPIRRIALSVTAGAILVTLGMLAFVVAYEDLGRGIDLMLKVPRLHHTIWNVTLLGAYRAYNNAPRLDWAIGTFAGFVVAFFALKLPRRALLAGVLPVGGFIVFAMQGKGFPYHLHMLTLGTSVMQLVILGAIARWVQSAQYAIDRAKVGHAMVEAITLALFLGAIAFSAKSGEDAWKSPSIRQDWATIGDTAEKRASRAYVNRFPWGDFFASDLRDTAAYLKARTRPDERVQTYGFDPYVLFLAQRKSASPVIYNFELNVDAALEGGPGAKPSPELQSWLHAYRDAAEKLVLESVEASPPAAFTLHDRAPFTHPDDAERDFAEHCPTLFAWMKDRYVFAKSFGTMRIWLRRDVMVRAPMTTTE
ncbi:MAG: hypothetical protein FWD73_15870 [Polyangiaceae bacterium]|nr:hypothetical protein [Polyangiaceae bacterium]